MLSVQIAFNPTNITSTTQVWTDVTPYVKDFTTNSGKQHYLDRVEASTIQITFDNRSGFFLNGTTNQTGYVLQPRCPIRVVTTYGGISYPIYFGLIDQITENVADQLNYELSVQASDLTKYLSLKYLLNPAFWKTYASVSSASTWLRCSNSQIYTVTGATSTGSSVTYQCVNNFSIGQIVTVSGLTTATGSSLNVQGAQITSVTPNSFTVSYAVTGTASGTGTAYNTVLTDQISGSTAFYDGVVSFPSNGAVIYDSNGCVDLANGSGSATGYIDITNVLGSGSYTGLDFWTITQTETQSYMAYVNATSGGTNYYLYLTVSDTGNYQVLAATVADPTTILYGTDTGVKITDGYWHHVGLAEGSNGYLQAYVDGQFYPLTTLTTLTSFNANTGSGYVSQMGTQPGSTTPTFAGYVDEIVLSNTAFTPQDLLNRYKAGSLLQLGFPTTANSVWSGDRIAEILCLAGFGSIVNGQVSLTCNFSIGNSYGTLSAWSPNVSTNGAVYVEPYYWNSPIYNSTALDLILQICDTDIGMFIQQPDGSFVFYNQNYYGTWNWNGTSGTWTPSSSAWASTFVLSDTNVGTPYYGPSLQIIRDDADLWTTVKVAPQSGVTQIYENTGNETRWGFSTLTKSGTVHTSLSSALSTANFLGYLFSSPLPRVQAVELRSETFNGGSLPVMLSAVPAKVVFFTRNSVNYSSSGTYPSQEGSIVNQPMVIEAVMHDFVADPGYWHTTFILDPYPVRS